jgi:1-acyl-sn-glycerol-3-phosphate acyltransferase
MRVKIHAHIETLGKVAENRKEIREEAHALIYAQLLEFENKK